MAAAADPRTRRDRIRLDAVRATLSALADAARAAGAAVLVHGSAALALRDPGFPRTPADLDVAVADPGLFDVLATSGHRVRVDPAGPVPFRPGRVVAPVFSYVATVTCADGGVVDRFLVEAVADARRAGTGDGTGALRWQRVEFALADKYQSYMRVRDGRRNTRWVDLADSIHLIGRPAALPGAGDLRRARDAVLGWDTASALHPAPPDPPPEWAAPWRKARAVDAPGLGDLAAARDLFAAFWDLPDHDGRWTGREWARSAAR